LDKDDEEILKTLKEKVETIAKEMENCRLQSAANNVISVSRLGNQYLNEKEPWKLIKKDRDKALNVIYVAAQIVKALAIISAPFIPFAAEELWKTLNLPGSVHEQRWDEALKPLPAKHKIAEAKPLFRKIEASEKELDELLAKVREKLKKV
jgi:methionyl-tRNA synthetase